MFFTNEPMFDLMDSLRKIKIEEKDKANFIKKGDLVALYAPDKPNEEIRHEMERLIGFEREDVGDEPGEHGWYLGKGPSIFRVKSVHPDIYTASAKGEISKEDSRSMAKALIQKLGLTNESRDGAADEKIEEKDKAKPNNPQTMKPQEKPDLKADDHSMEDYSDEDLDKPKDKGKDTGHSMREVPDKELQQLVDTKESVILEVQLSVQAAASEMGYPYHDTMQYAIKGKKIYHRFLNKDKSEGIWIYDKDDFVKDIDDTFKVVKLYHTGKSESRFGRAKGQLYICNSCFKTFRANESICPLCKKNEFVEKIVTEQFFKHVYDVQFELNGKKDSTRVEAFDEADARSWVNRTKRGVKILGVTKVQENAEPKNGDRIPDGLADKAGKKPEDFDKEQLAAGVKIEMEHTSDPKVAEKIAMDHLTEDPEYYIKLKKMEAGDNNPCPEGKVPSDKGMGHELIIDSEEDGQAHCGCGKWFYNITGRLDKDNLKREYEKHSKLTVPEGKVPLDKDQESTKVKKLIERVKELINEVPDINPADQKALHWAVDNGLIDDEFPDNVHLLHGLKSVSSKFRPEEVEQLETASGVSHMDLHILYMKYILLPKAKAAYRAYMAKESKVNEQDKDTLMIVAKGLVDKAQAERIAREKKGTAVVDDEDPKKWMVVVKESMNKIIEKAGGKVIGKSSGGEDVTVEEDDFLNSLGRKIGETGFGYRFVGEQRLEDRMIFEFASSDAPKIELIVYGKVVQE